MSDALFPLSLQGLPVTVTVNPETRALVEGKKPDVWVFASIARMYAHAHVGTEELAPEERQQRLLESVCELFQLHRESWQIRGWAARAIPQTGEEFYLKLSAEWWRGNNPTVCTVTIQPRYSKLNVVVNPLHDPEFEGADA